MQQWPPCGYENTRCSKGFLFGLNTRTRKASSRALPRASDLGHRQIPPASRDPLTHAKLPARARGPVASTRRRLSPQPGFLVMRGAAQWRKRTEMARGIGSSPDASGDHRFTVRDRAGPAPAAATHVVWCGGGGGVRCAARGLSESPTARPHAQRGHTPAASPVHLTTPSRGR